jgi:hypothetical protein
MKVESMSPTNAGAQKSTPDIKLKSETGTASIVVKIEKQWTNMAKAEGNQARIVHDRAPSNVRSSAKNICTIPKEPLAKYSHEAV